MSFFDQNLDTDDLDNLFINLINLLPLSCQVSDAVEASFRSKNQNKQFCTVFRYPDIGKKTFSANQIICLARHAECKTVKKIVKHINWLCVNFDINQTEILNFIFMLFIKLRKNFLEISRALKIAHQFRGTNKVSFYRFRNTFPIPETLSQNCKLYNCGQLLALDVIAQTRSVKNVFQFCVNNVFDCDLPIDDVKEDKQIIQPKPVKKTYFCEECNEEHSCEDNEEKFVFNKTPRKPPVPQKKQVIFENEEEPICTCGECV